MDNVLETRIITSSYRYVYTPNPSAVTYTVCRYIPSGPFPNTLLVNNDGNRRGFSLLFYLMPIYILYMYNDVLGRAKTHVRK